MNFTRGVFLGQLENRDWTLNWTGLDWTGLFLRGVIFLGGGVVGTVLLFFVVCEKMAFSTFSQQAIFFHFGAGGKGCSIL